MPEGSVVGEVGSAFDLAQRGQRRGPDQNGFPGGNCAQGDQSAAARIGGLLRGFDRERVVFMSCHALVGHRRAMNVVVNGARFMDVSTDS